MTSPPSSMPGCVLCRESGGKLVWRGPLFRLIRAEEAGFPAFYRLVWNTHVRELSELPRPQQIACMDALAVIESVVRAHLSPTKINLASLGNAVPHLHWHVIARFDWDSHFPASVWAQALRPLQAQKLEALTLLLPALEDDVRHKLSAQDSTFF